jgi:TIR domain
LVAGGKRRSTDEGTNVSFDVFLSYARADNDDGWVTAFHQSFFSIYQKLTGASPPIFYDREAIITASIWAKRIQKALSTSEALVAILSPSFIRSPWCRLEWGAFEITERKLRHDGALSSDEGVIFPVLLYPLDRGRFSSDEEAFVAQVKQRQWFDASSKLDGTPIRREQVRSLAETLIDTVGSIRARRRTVEKGIAASASLHQPTIIDALTGLEWSGNISPREMTIGEARAYVAALPAEKGGQWAAAN